MNSQFTLGKKIELEHKRTFAKVQRGQITNMDQFASSIAKDHLREDKKYYSKLKSCKL